MRHFGGAESPGRPAPGTGVGRKGLKSDALGLFSSVVIGIASTAPAYSLAATLGLIVTAVGLQAPIVTMMSFLPMLLIAYAFRELNASNADCGTTFTWATRAFGPRTGWMGGWGIVVANVIVMASLAEIAGSYGFRLVGQDGLAEDRLWTTVAGVVWIAVMTAVCYVGIEFSAAVQRWLLCLEVCMLLLFAVAALVKVYTDPPSGATHVSASWFNPFEVSSVKALTSGLLAGVFIYWGWDTAVSINEETVDSTRIPGRAAVLSTVVLLVLYALVATSAQAFAGVGSSGIGLGNPDDSDDVLSGLGKAVFGDQGAGLVLTRLLILMVLTSALASTLTTILPLARTVFSMAVHKAVPARFARVHRRFLTPTWSTIGMGAVSVAFLVVLTSFSGNVLADSIDSVGLAITFQYGMTGFACLWYHRGVLSRSTKDLVFKGLLPALGGLIMFCLFCYAAYVYAAPGYGATSVDLPLLGPTGGVTFIGLGALLLGLLLMPVVTRGHTVALKLQRSLLPRRLPPHTAVDSASRYLPADSGSGVGGDWYDVIPLSGTRVGLVVGDVLGHGLRAAATMGRLRTGVRVLARLDLAPDELLSRLGDLAEQAVYERDAGDPGAPADASMGVACLYAVYDPVSGECSLARAGESVLAVVEPRRGEAHHPQLPPGPPLGVAGVPYRSTELRLPPGSLLALFTGGLLQATDGGDAGRAELFRVLAWDRDGRESLDELCDRAVNSLLPGPVDVDATLLLVRTRLLDRTRFAEWELPPDPAAVATIRAAVGKQLGDWGLDELVFTTELIVSELVTNAIRYAGGPVRVRLIRDRTLICEVSDPGHTAPNLRHAATDDEGGRGLFIIAQMTHHWGTRYTPTGKTLWTEQDLSPPAGP
ncbi:amino acid permease [Streptomyces collinus]|uniref:amino acid permease n=1 Tax=Streptomyces collinus TaxID=42684 RepID=UPI002942EC78|nr:amino acid permease [Streptomyces collinus]